MQEELRRYNNIGDIAGIAYFAKQVLGDSRVQKSSIQKLCGLQNDIRLNFGAAVAFFKYLNLIEEKVGYLYPTEMASEIRASDDFNKALCTACLVQISKDGFLDTECTFYDAAEEMSWTKNWVGWVVLCRANSEVEAVEAYLTKQNIPNVIVKRGDLDLEHMGSLLEENRVKIMTIHASKGLEFDHVVVMGAKTFNQEERRICYVAATRAMKSLYWCPTIRTYKGKARGTKHFAGHVMEKSGVKNITF